MGDKCERQVWETSVGDKWETSVKFMRAKTPRVGDNLVRQVQDKCKIMRPTAPMCQGQVGDKSKIMRPKAPSGRQVRETSGRQV